MSFRKMRRSRPKMGAKAFPLRKITGEKSVEIKTAHGGSTGVFITHEVLECGHTMAPRTDFVGVTNATARRCAQCATALHTPGPWKAYLNAPLAAIPGHLIKTDDEVERPIASLWIGGGTKGKPTQVANALLIAAAPEMLEALKMALDLFQPNHALSRFNWGKAGLRAEDIRELNELPLQIRRAISKAQRGQDNP